MWKAYGHVQALSDVSFTVGSGEVVALVGDNGAGKSTLIKIIAGVHRPDVGRMYVRGTETHFNHPLDSQRAGISTIYQHLALVEALDVTRNMFLGHEPARFRLVDRRRMLKEARAVFDELGIKAPSMRDNVGMLSGGQRQGVAIARAVLQGGDVIVMDEPTAALGVRETAQVLTIVRKLRDRGKTVILVSHNLELVFDIADRIVVLRLGRVVGNCITRESNRRGIVELITGGDVSAGVVG
jgi:ribose transport system ATP-binding protein